MFGKKLRLFTLFGFEVGIDWTSILIRLECHATSRCAQNAEHPWSGDKSGSPTTSLNSADLTELQRIREPATTLLQP
jgi:hypothetical protein